MKPRLPGVILALWLAIGVSAAASAQEKLSVAVMPAQHFAADAESAANLTRALVGEFERRGYEVVSVGRARATFGAKKLSASKHYPDRVPLDFGRSLNADLVVYPRLLSLGIQAADGPSPRTSADRSAVVLLRIYNVHTKGNIFVRQAAHHFQAEAPYRLSEPEAESAVTALTREYFQRVAGTRKETGGR
jgi:hypothetical protein